MERKKGKENWKYLSPNKQEKWKKLEDFFMILLPKMQKNLYDGMEGILGGFGRKPHSVQIANWG